MATEQEHCDAVVAFLNGLGALACDRGDAPTTWNSSGSDKFTVVSVARRFGGVQRASGDRDGQLWRITIWQVAKLYQPAQNLRAKAAGLEGAVLTIAGATTTPVEFETADDIGPDDGWFSGIQTWTYALI